MFSAACQGLCANSPTNTLALLWKTLNGGLVLRLRRYLRELPGLDFPFMSVSSWLKREHMWFSPALLHSAHARGRGGPFLFANRTFPSSRPLLELMYDECAKDIGAGKWCFASACRETAWISLASSLLWLTGPLIPHTKEILHSFKLLVNKKHFQL